MPVFLFLSLLGSFNLFFWSYVIDQNLSTNFYTVIKENFLYVIDRTTGISFFKRIVIEILRFLMFYYFFAFFVCLFLKKIQKIYSVSFVNSY